MNKLTTLPLSAVALAVALSLTACGDDEARNAQSANTPAASSASTADGSARSGADSANNAASSETADGASVTDVQQQPGTMSSSSSPEGNVGGTLSGDTPSNPAPGSASSQSNMQVAANDSANRGATPGSAATGITTGATPGKEATATVGLTERTFIAKAAEGGLLEVEAGKVVQERGSSADVKQLAERLVSDHTTANQELTQLAASKNITLPTQLSKENQAEVDKLRKAQGSEVDRMYVRNVGLDHHRKDIAEFERAARESNDPDIRAFAQKTLPILREHRNQAQKVASVSQK